MKTSSEDGRPGLILQAVFSVVASVLVLVGIVRGGDKVVEEPAPLAPEAEAVLSDVRQLAQTLDKPWGYPQTFPFEPALYEVLETWWVEDFERLPKELAAVREFPSVGSFGVSFYPVRLVEAVDSGVVSVQAPEYAELVRFERGEGKLGRALYDDLLYQWCALSGIQPAPYAELLAQGYDFLKPRRIVAHVWLGKLAEAATYYANLAEAAAKWNAELALVVQPEFGVASMGLLGEEGGGGGMMLLLSGDCATDDESPFVIELVKRLTNGWTEITFTTCTDRVYAVRSADVLSTNTAWQTREAWVGLYEVKTWTDQATTNVAQRFYQVARLQFDEDSDGDGLTNLEEADTYGTDPLDWDTDGDWLPDGWEVDHEYDPLEAEWDTDYDGDDLPDWWELFFGLDPETDDASGDPDSDGRSNLQEYYDGTDPNVAQPGGVPLDVIVNGGKAWATSTNITLQPVAIPYPKFKVSAVSTMSNATVYANTLDPVSYALPMAGDVTYFLYLQYASYNGTAIGPVMFKTVTLDTRPPFVQITGPTTNAAANGNQAFIHLQAAVYDYSPLGAAAPNRFLTVRVNGWTVGRVGTEVDWPRWPVAVGTNEITVTATDAAGHTTGDTLIWIVSATGDTNAPTLSNFNVSTATLIPDVPELWVQADVDDENAIVTATVNGGAAINLNYREQKFGYPLPLEFGTNVIVVTASDLTGNAKCYTNTVERTDRFYVDLTAPAFGAFANGVTQTVSGRVSLKLDAGQTNETGIAGVSVNGLAATLDWGEAAGGLVPWTAASVPPPPCTNSVMPLIVSLCWTNGGLSTNLCHDVPLGLLEGYEITAKHQWLNNRGVAALGQTNGQWAISYTSPDWPGRTWSDLTFQLLCGMESNQTAVGSAATWWPNESPVACPDPECLTWVGFTNCVTERVAQPARGLQLGKNRSDSGGVLNALNGQVYPYRGHYRGEADGYLKFRVPWYYATNQLVILTFEGLQYSTAGDHTMNLTNVYFVFNGVANAPLSTTTNSVSYDVTVTGGAEYVVDESSFIWPETAGTTNYSLWDGHNYTQQSAAHQLSFVDLHNKRPQVRIYRGPRDITGEITNTVIGERISLDTALVDAGGLVVSDRVWSIPPVAVGDWIANTTTGYVVDVIGRYSNAVSFAWVNGGAGRTVVHSVLFTNGRIARGWTTFEVLAPSAVSITTTTTTVAVGANYIEPCAKIWLHYGSEGACGLPISYGIKLVGTAKDPQGYSGQIQFTQVISNTIDFVQFEGGTTHYVQTNGLDALVRSPAHISDVKVSGTSTITAKDSPALLMRGPSWPGTNGLEEMVVGTWLMWSPTNVAEQLRVWVPLQKVDWSWFATATLSGTNWVLTSTNNTVNPAGSATTNFPVWNCNANPQ